MKLNVTKLVTAMYILHEMPNLRQIICHANVLLSKIMHNIHNKLFVTFREDIYGI